MKEKNQQYKDFKNYIHNDCGISKDEMITLFREILADTIKDEVKKFLNNHERIEDIIESEVKRHVIDDIKQHPYLSRYNHKHVLEDSITDFYDEVYRKLKENILDNVEISFKGVSNNG